MIYSSGSAAAPGPTTPPLPLFRTAVNYPVGAQPQGITVADFNSDGKVDLATANFCNCASTNDVSIFLGNGDGTFQPHIDYLISNSGGGIQYYGITAGDLNGDAKADLIVTNAAGSTVSVLLNRGDGTFLPNVNYVAGYRPYEVVVGDFNGDGKRDLATSAFGDYIVSILLGNGDGTFQTKIDTSLGLPIYSATALCAGDFNADGKLDVAASSPNSNSVNVLLGKGDGTFQPPVYYPIGPNAQGVKAGDLNGDGKLDLVSVSNTNTLGPFGVINANPTVSVMLGRGDGTFRAATEFSTGDGPTAISLGDFNLDGKLDIATTNGGQVSSLSILEGIGDGTFAAHKDYSVGNASYPVSLALGDFNNDGRLDVATSNNFSRNISIFLGAPSNLLTLLSEQNSTRAIALESTSFMHDPFSLSYDNLSQDHRTRVILFAQNLELLPGEDVSNIETLATDSQGKRYQLPVEYVGKVPGFDWLTEVVIKLPDQIETEGIYSVSITIHGTVSNQVMLTLKK